MTASQPRADHRGRPMIGPTKAASILGVDVRTVTRWADTGQLPTAGRTLGGHRRFLLAAVTDLRDQLARNGVDPTPVDPDQLTIGDD